MLSVEDCDILERVALIDKNQEVILIFGFNVEVAVVFFISKRSGVEATLFVGRIVGER